MRDLFLTTSDTVLEAAKRAKKV